MSPKIRAVALFALASVAVLGCELALDFDRSKIDAGGGGDASLSDAPEVDANPQADASDAATRDVASDVASEAAVDAAPDTGVDAADASSDTGSDTSTSDAADASDSG